MKLKDLLKEKKSDKIQVRGLGTWDYKSEVINNLFKKGVLKGLK